ncbi:hypothetical protein RBH29_16895 [Herbivorax sp. ANBcel31]|uniref:hypothetical protein n=1 Tax=Herbivorax sp. ANBcel31 TaxID=3069754 RepID=UPI0027B52680|nr:hypothetical protein [Herbivorax sp. ANBcel31]MDQ2088106.1 hypothetical protein [Herbivorax sp. ANBcel31]
MATFGDRFGGYLQECKVKLEELSKRDFEIDELKDILSSIGTKFELFLKSVIFPSISSRNNLVVFINELLNYGFVQNEVDLFHDLRKAYNNSKHEPTYRPSIIEILKLIDQVTIITDKLINLGLGQTNNYIRSSFSRVFWIAAWDHYDGGDTEIHISLPDESGRWLGPLSIDMIYIELLSWETVKLELSNVGILKTSNQLIPQKLLSEWSSEGDFLDALVFEGYYKDLISVLSQHEKRIELMPGLMRHHDLRAMVQACILSTIDVITNISQNDKPTLIKEIKMQAVNVYAIPENYEKLLFIIESFVEMIHDIEISNWVRISGIKWLKEDEYELGKESAITVNKEYKVFIDENHTFCMIGN